MSTVISRRAARHHGAGADSDMTRMAAELAAMAQDDTLAARTACAQAPRTHRVAGTERVVRMADRYHPQLSAR